MLANRDFVVDRLCDDDFDYITEHNGLELLDSYIKFGFKGYMAFTDAELISEMKQRGFEEEIVYE